MLVRGFFNCQGFVFQGCDIPEKDLHFLQDTQGIQSNNDTSDVNKKMLEINSHTEKHVLFFVFSCLFLLRTLHLIYKLNNIFHLKDKKIDHEISIDR